MPLCCLETCCKTNPWRCHSFWRNNVYLKFSELEDRKCVREGDDSFNSMSFLCFLLIMWLCKAAFPTLEIIINCPSSNNSHRFGLWHAAIWSLTAAIQALNFHLLSTFRLRHTSPLSRSERTAREEQLCRVEDGKNVGENFVQWWQKAKQPRDTQQRNHHHTRFNAESKRWEQF